jgi:hypothetical protein
MNISGIRTSPSDRARWLNNLTLEAAEDLGRIVAANSELERTNAVAAARAHNRSWSDIAIALALGQD